MNYNTVYKKVNNFLQLFCVFDPLDLDDVLRLDAHVGNVSLNGDASLFFIVNGYQVNFSSPS